MASQIALITPGIGGFIPPAYVRTSFDRVAAALRRRLRCARSDAPLADLRCRRPGFDHRAALAPRVSGWLDLVAARAARTTTRCSSSVDRQLLRPVPGGDSLCRSHLLRPRAGRARGVDRER